MLILLRPCQGSIVVAGDAKTYLWLRELKQLCGSELDWHVLNNYQKALMKVYYEGGLKDERCRISGMFLLSGRTQTL